MSNLCFVYDFHPDSATFVFVKQQRPLLEYFRNIFFSMFEADPLDHLDQYTYNDPGNTYLQILMMTLKLLISNMSKM